MPDASGKFKGTGWSRSSAAAWDRVFGRPPVGPTQEEAHAWMHQGHLFDVPTKRAAEVPRFEDERADDAAARDGFNPEW